jgi:hypothetical protein
MVKCRRRDLVRKLKEYFKPPLDLRDLYANFRSWFQLFRQHLGILLILIGIKYPTARAEFVRAYRREKSYDGGKVAEKVRVFKALAASCERFRDPELYGKLRADIDEIKGPALAHGYCLYMQKLCVVKSAEVGIRLGATTATFEIRPYSKDAGNAIEGFLRMHDVLDGLPKISSVALYKTAKRDVFEAFTKHRVCQLAVKSAVQYNREWTFRSYVVPHARSLGVLKLYHSSTDVVSDLPGPDMMGARSILGASGRIDDLYEKDGISVAPEYVCAQACLSTGRFKGNAVSSGPAQMRLKLGACVVCTAGCRGARMCRIELGHTAPAVKKKLSMKRVYVTKTVAGMQARCSVCTEKHRSAFYCRMVLGHKRR